MRTKRFILHPGYVRSLTDGDTHYISGDQLARLYGIDPEECVIHSDHPHFPHDDPELQKLIPLFPLREGGYKEHLRQMKIGDFRRYVRAKKLYEHHTSGTSPRRGAMRRLAAEKQARSIAWHEKHWPDFRAAYDRMEKQK